MDNILALFKKINCFIFDVDGVLTNGNLIVMPNGSLVRTMHVRDGFALHLAIQKKYPIYIISGGNSIEIIDRLKNIGVTNIYMQVMDKKTVLNEIILENNFDPKNILYMGDDVPDLKAMQLVGLPCCPNDAADEIKTISTYISFLKGGEGCVRDVIEKVLKLQNNWDNDSQIPSA